MVCAPIANNHLFSTDLFAESGMDASFLGLEVLLHSVRFIATDDSVAMITNLLLRTMSTNSKVFLRSLLDMW